MYFKDSKENITEYLFEKEVLSHVGLKPLL